MHTLTLFPALLSYPLLAYLILRLLVVFGVARTASARWSKSFKYFALAEAVAGVFILLGLYTQAALVVAIVLLKIDWWIDRPRKPINSPETIVLSLVILVAVALLFTGPGSFAIDYPL